MGKSKPSPPPAPPKPPPDPMEIALANIGRDVAGDYETNYRPMNEKLLSMAGVDRSNQAAGRSAVDAQLATSDQMAGAIIGGADKGGFGGAGSISLVDAGAVGGAVQGAASAGYGAGRQTYADRLSGAASAVQSGQDTATQGLRGAASIASQDALSEYNHTQRMNLERYNYTNTKNSINQQGIAQVIGAAGQGYFAGQSLATPTQAPVQASTQAPSMQGQPLGTGLINQGQNYLQRVNPWNQTWGA